MKFKDWLFLQTNRLLACFSFGLPIKKMGEQSKRFELFSIQDYYVRFVQFSETSHLFLITRGLRHLHGNATEAVGILMNDSTHLAVER